MADKRISQLVDRGTVANNDVVPIVVSGATTTNKATISSIQTFMQGNLDLGVTSVGLSMPSAFVVSASPVTTSGNISVTGAGTVGQYIRGNGTLADFPSISGGGSSVSYYLNGSVSQGTIGGIAYLEMNKVPILGAGTDFNISANGYIASFITDAGDPALLQIPGGNWNFETVLSANSSAGSPTFYIELYKVNSGGTATLIASNSATPENIAFGATIHSYFSALAVPTTTLTLTDRLALRYYVTHSGRTITLHTENGHLCQIITTFTTGLTALNGLTAQVQNFTTGTSGTDFEISSTSATHTFNLPDASATARGVVTTGIQTIAGIKNFTSTIRSAVSVEMAASGTALPTELKNINGPGLSSFGSNGIGFNSSNNLYFAGSEKGCAVISMTNTGTRTYTLQDASGTLAFTSDISTALTGYVTLATAQTITAQKTFTTSGGTDSVIISQGSGSGIALDVIKAGSGQAIRVQKTSGGGDAVTITGGRLLAENGTFTGQLSTLTGGHTITLTSNLGGATNRIESSARPLEIVTAGSSITLSAGGATPQFTLASSGAVTLTGALNGTSASFTADAVVNGVNIGRGGGNVDTNTRVGTNALNANTTGVGNTALGWGSLFTNTSGVSNVSIGRDSGRFLADGTTPITVVNNSIFIGRLTRSLADNQTNQIVIGNQAVGLGNSTIVIGNSSTTFGRWFGNLLIGDSTNTGEQLQVTGTSKFTGALNGTSAVFSGAVSSSQFTANGNSAGGFEGLRIINASTGAAQIALNNSAQSFILNTRTDNQFSIFNATNSTTPFLINQSTGAATFSSSVTAEGTFFGRNNAVFQNTTTNIVNVGSDQAMYGGSNSDGGLFIYGNNKLHLSTNSQRRLTIDGSGNVGIGTATPVTTLSIETSGVQNTISPVITAQSSGTTYGGMYSIRDGAGDQRGLIFQNFTANVGLTEKMRITSGGNLLVATTDLPSATTKGFGVGVDSFGTFIQNRVNTTSNYGQVGFFNPNGQVGSITTNGSVTSYNMTSDYRLKEDLQEIKGLEKVQAIKVYDYKWKSDESRMDGVLAHELAEVLPYAVTGEKDEMNEDGTDKMQSVDYSKIVPILIKAIQELKTEIDSLKNQIK